uniref:LigA n=1 Tax=Parastrongyloides trichosuri TaxID=131310 RepID=A0A0N5A4K1_PARTI
MLKIQHSVGARQPLRADRPAAGDGDLLRIAHQAGPFARMAEARVAVEEDVHLARGAEGQGAAVVDLGLHHRAGDEEVGRGQGLAVGARQHVLHRRAHGGGQAVSRADGDDAAARPREGVQLGHGRLGGDVAQPAAVFGGDALGRRLRALGGGGEVGRDHVRGEDQNIEVLVKVACVEALGIDDLERIFELLQHPLGPARGHGTAVAVDQADAHRFQGDLLAARRAGDRVGVQAQVAHGRLDDRTGLVVGRNPQGAGRQGRATRAGFALLPVDGQTRRQQAVGQQIAVDRRMIDQPSGAAIALDLAGRRGHDIAHALGRRLEAVQDAVELHAHLHGQGVARGVIGQFGRAARILQVVRVVLRLEHVQNVRAIGLGRLHHIGTRRIGLSPNGEGARRPLHIHPGLDQAIQEGDGGGQVGLVRRDDIAARIAPGRVAQHALIQGRIDSASVFTGRRVQGVDRRGRDPPGVGIALVDGVLAHAPDVEQHPILVARGVVQHRPVDRLRVLNRLGETPGLGRHRQGQVVAGQLVVRDQADLAGGRMAGDLGQQADRIVEIGDGALHPVVPCRIVGPAAHGRAGLALLDQAAVHGGPDLGQGAHDQRVVVVVEGVAERRHEDHGPRRRRLVVVVDDLREPLAEELPIDVGRLGHGRQVVVAVVIVADVLLIQHRDAVVLALQRILVAHVPGRNQLPPVRVQRREQDDYVVQDALGLGVLGRQPFIEGGDQGLRRHRLGGVQAAVDPHYGLAFGGQGAGLVLADALGLGQAPRDLLIAVDVGQVLRRGDDREVLRPSFRRATDLQQLHPVGLPRQGMQIALELGVGDQAIVRSDLMAERLQRRGQGAGGRRGRRRGGGEGGRRLKGQGAGRREGQDGQAGGQVGPQSFPDGGSGLGRSVEPESDHRRLPALDQDDHRAAGVHDSGGGHRAHGGRRFGGADRRQDHDLVHRRLDRVAGAGRGGQRAGGFDGRLLAAWLHHPPGADLDLRRHGQERDPADRRLLGLRRHGGRRPGRQGPGGAAPGRTGRSDHAEGHRVRDEAGPAGDLCGPRLDHRDAGPGDAGGLRQVRRRLLCDHGRAVGAAVHRRLLRHRKARDPAVRRDPHPGPAGLLDRQLGSRLSADPRRPAEGRRASSHRLVRVAAGLLVQPRRFDALLHLRDHLHHPGARRAPDGPTADLHAAAADGDLEGHRRRAARLAGGDHGHPHLFRPAGSLDRHRARRRPPARHGPLGDQRGRQLGRRRGGGEVGRRTGGHRGPGSRRPRRARQGERLAGRRLRPGADAKRGARLEHLIGLRLGNRPRAARGADRGELGMPRHVEQQLVPVPVLHIVPFARVEAHLHHVRQLRLPPLGGVCSHQLVRRALVDERRRLH